MSEFVGGRPLPRAVTTLGFELSWADVARGEAEVFFSPPTEFTNLMGFVQGGFVSAMLDAVASTALLATLPPDQFAPTIEMKTSYLRPVPTARVKGLGRIVHRGRSIAFLDASLYALDGDLLATATATARIVTM